jgi:uncharacterized protein YggE
VGVEGPLDKEATMKAKARWGAAGVILGLAAALTLPSLAQTTSPPPTPTGSGDRTVTVTGTSTIRSAPDEAVITLGVQTQSQSAQDALQENATKMSKVVDALMGDGIKPADLATVGVNLYPNYDSNGTTVVSYTAQNQVNATVHDLAKVGQVIDDSVAAGANLASGISFQLSDQNQGVEQALADAVANAKSKAEAIAAAGDATLGQIVQVTEGGGYAPPVPYFAAAADSAGGTTPVQPGTIETQVTVTAVWSLT